jgi:uncharacterized protein (DUF2336 family)
MGTSPSLISELDAAIQSSSSDKRIATLRRVTDLFLSHAGQYDPEQMKLFDGVLMRMIGHIETRALAELGERLAPVDGAPVDVIRHLANHDEIVVAGPVLKGSTQLTSDDLVDIARRKSQDHLLAISGRSEIDEAVTDVLVDRGNAEVARKVAVNAGDLTQALNKVARELQAERPVRDYSEAQHLVGLLNREGKLSEAALLEFARANKFEEAVSALAMRCSAPIDIIDRLMHGARIDALLIPCKAAGLAWPTTRAIIRLNSAHSITSDDDFEIAKQDFQKLSIAAAQRIMRFWQVRSTVTMAGMPPLPPELAAPAKPTSR